LSFAHLDTGKVKTVARDLMGMAEESDEMPEMPKWQEREWDIVLAIVADERYRRLPTHFDIHEWDIMRAFCGIGEAGAAEPRTA
jgi:hypothetical protein